MNDTPTDKPAPKPEKSRPPRHEVVFYAYPKLIFAWPIILLGFVFIPLAGHGPKITKETQVTVQAEAAAAEPADGAPGAEGEAGADAAAEAPATLTETREVSYYAHSGRLEVLGWIYLVAVLLVVLTVGVDIERNVAVFWLVVFIMFFFIGRWLSDAQGFTLFGNIYNFFDGLNVQYSRGLGVAVSILLAIPYGVIVFWARIQNKWRITHNEFEHYSWGRADDSLARGAKRVRSTYPDLLEFLLLGSGKLVVYSATGRSELRRIHNIPMLPLLRRRIDSILEKTAVTSMRDDLAEEEVATEHEETDSVSDDDAGDAIGNERL